jgi:hypothetical protein
LREQTAGRRIARVASECELALGVVEKSSLRESNTARQMVPGPRTDLRDQLRAHNLE